MITTIKFIFKAAVIYKIKKKKHDVLCNQLKSHFSIVSIQLGANVSGATSKNDALLDPRVSEH